MLLTQFSYFNSFLNTFVTSQNLLELNADLTVLATTSRYSFINRTTKQGGIFRLLVITL